MGDFDFVSRAEFKEMDPRELDEMTDHELALWQSRFPMASPQFLLATHVWNRRLLAKELQTVRWCSLTSSCIGLAGVVLGVILTAIASACLK